MVEISNKIKKDAFEKNKEALVMEELDYYLDRDYEHLQSMGELEEKIRQREASLNCL